MRIYIVMLRHAMDDLPIAAYAGRNGKEADTARGIAFAVAEKTGPMPTETQREIFATDCSTPCNVSVVEMLDGVVHSVSIVKTFEDEA